mmetsp:Transcript_159812/g.508760  ORF Transcript_159812/g.508760 Transcript_159812/m.508760 type:complete len:256 (-) Transcript_159812:396-1163(-)
MWRTSTASRRKCPLLSGTHPARCTAGMILQQATSLLSVTTCSSAEEKVRSNPTFATSIRPSGVVGAAPEKTAASDVASANLLKFWCNPGSAGHPELCSRPCLSGAISPCSNGSDCEFCHFDHPQRPARLDKHQREILRGMPSKEWAGLMVPALFEKVLAFDSSHETHILLGDVIRSLNVAPSPLPRWAPRRTQRMLLLTLKAMSARTMLSAVQRTAAQRPDGWDNGPPLDALLNHLRALSFVKLKSSPAPLAHRI